MWVGEWREGVKCFFFFPFFLWLIFVLKGQPKENRRKILEVLKPQVLWCYTFFFQTMIGITLWLHTGPVFTQVIQNIYFWLKMVWYILLIVVPGRQRITRLNVCLLQCVVIIYISHIPPWYESKVLYYHCMGNRWKSFCFIFFMVSYSCDSCPSILTVPMTKNV